MVCYEFVFVVFVCDLLDILCLLEGVGLFCFGVEFFKIVFIVNDVIKMWFIEG